MGHTDTTPIFFTNTMSGKKERFVPLKPGIVTLYSCGPTVYNRAHIGNLRAYVFSDVLARTLIHSGYRVRRVINITDVGHLVGDGDDGDDKMEVGAKREGISAIALSERYTKIFLDELGELNIDTQSILFPRATQYIKEQISLAQTLQEKGFAYPLKDGLYFDTSRFAGYGKLGGVANASLEAGARVAVNDKKHNASDFALWKTTPNGTHPLQEWNSPWGAGSPGWHLECSAMSRALLGVEIDIHTGGMEHIPVHHNNEIAQSEAVSGRPFVHYWIHHEMLMMGNEKLSKSLGNVVYLSDIVERGIHQLALRYFFYQAHYRTPLSFSWSALSGAAEALSRLWRLSREIKKEADSQSKPSKEQKQFVAAMHDDLNTPQALGILWDSLHNEDIDAVEKWGVIVEADKLLELDLTHPPKEQEPLTNESLPQEIRELRNARDAARSKKDFQTADSLRDELRKHGYRVEDGENATLLYHASK